ncbi:MAG TPA: hypothetical protein VNA69_13740 [Thermoanaerobaculia bacterium]|nr:hypothetical protein [Thermoanaerobaculia bacterium]
MKHVIARSPEEIRAVLETLEGEHLPTRKAYLGSAVSALFLGVVAPAVLLWVLTNDDILDPRWWESILTAIIGPPLALELIRTSMARYRVDESGIECITPLGLGSWAAMRAEIVRIEANAGPLMLSLLIHTSTRRTPWTMLLRRKRARVLMQIFPELRRMAGQAIIAATAEEQARKRKNRIVLGALALFVVLLIAVIVAIEYVRR